MRLRLFAQSRNTCHRGHLVRLQRQNDQCRRRPFFGYLIVSAKQCCQIQRIDWTNDCPDRISIQHVAKDLVPSPAFFEKASVYFELICVFPSLVFDLSRHEAAMASCAPLRYDRTSHPR
jgi:hypothetical protein